MRLDELFPYPAGRTDSSDVFYSALGRAAAFCSLFEANWRVLALLLGLRVRTQEVALSQEVIDEFLQEAKKRRLAQHMDAVVMNLGLPREIREVLTQAREARNSVAHDFALDAVGQIVHSDGLAKKLNELADLVTKIATGDVMACVLGQALTNEDLPSRGFVEDYPSRIKRWVCGFEV